jgi:hypothetical protein
MFSIQYITLPLPNSDSFVDPPNIELKKSLNVDSYHFK